MLFKKEKFGKTPYKCAIIAGIHPMEDAGIKIFNLLRKNHSKLNFTLITAAEKISKQKKGSEKYNLNRLFNLANSPLNKRVKEYQLVKELCKEIMKYDLVIDIHSTNFKHPPYWIVVNITPLLERMIMVSHIHNVFVLNYKNVLIALAKNAMAIEIGNNDNENTVFEAYRNLNLVLSNFEKSKAKNFEKRRLSYFVSVGEFKKDFINKLSKNIKDFQFVKKDSLLGYKNNKKVYSPLSFYPLWVEKNNVDKNYPVICHILKKIDEDYFF